jgi:hypothetical protein
VPSDACLWCGQHASDRRFGVFDAWRQQAQVSGQPALPVDHCPAQQVLCSSVEAVDVGKNTGLLHDEDLLARSQHGIDISVGKFGKGLPLPLDHRSFHFINWRSRNLPAR